MQEQERQQQGRREQDRKELGRPGKKWKKKNISKILFIFCCRKIGGPIVGIY